jgi:4,5-DOPA dioxygenase extradiol
MTQNKKSSLMPVLFIGHGSPMNAVKDNGFTQSLYRLGQTTEPPVAILVISAHWLTMHETAVSINPKPHTIYDFGGFPEELYRLRYEPPGHPSLAKDLSANVHSLKIHEDHEMGLDHGAWTILRHMYPEAVIPAFQMSIDYAKPPQFHFDLAKELQHLRRKGVLIIGSGNIVHNLGILNWNDEDAVPFDWAAEFDGTVKKKILTHDYTSLIQYQSLGAAARMSVPTNDHYLPMLYILGLMEKAESVKFTYEAFQHGSISMRCFESTP